jgi:hypothetical protein
MKKIAFSIIVVELLMSFSFLAKEAYAKKPSQGNSSNNYPQITSSSICNIRVISPGSTQPIALLDFIARRGISVVTSSDHEKITLPEIRGSCEEPGEITLILQIELLVICG